MTDATPGNEIPIVEPSRTLPTLGRILLCFNANGWPNKYGGGVDHGARAGIVALAFPGSCNANVRVFLDEANDDPAAQSFLSSAMVFDPLTPEQRMEVKSRSGYWCEWMPYQAGQAKLTETVTTQLQNRYDGLDTRMDMAEQAINRVFGVLDTLPKSSARPDGDRLGALETRFDTLLDRLMSAPALDDVNLRIADACGNNAPAPSSTPVSAGVVGEVAKG